MIIKVGGGLEPLGPIGVYAYASLHTHTRIESPWVCGATSLRTVVTAKQRRGVGTAGATGALAPAMLKPRGRVCFRPRNIFPHFCMLVLKLPLFVVVLPAYN